MKPHKMAGIIMLLLGIIVFADIYSKTTTINFIGDKAKGFIGIALMGTGILFLVKK